MEMLQVMGDLQMRRHMRLVVRSRTRVGPMWERNSSGSSASSSSATLAEAPKDEALQVTPQQRPERAEEKAAESGDGGTNVVDAVLELMVRSVLAGVQVIIVISWVMGRVAAGLEFVVELGLVLIHGSANN